MESALVTVLTALLLLIVWSLGQVPVNGYDSPEEQGSIYHILSNSTFQEVEERCQMIKEDFQSKYPGSFKSVYERGADDCVGSRRLMESWSEMKEDLLDELSLTAGHGQNLIMCCDKWLNADIISAFQKRSSNFEDSQINRSRQKREELYQWTCSQIRDLPVLFITSTTDEIDEMDNVEFVDCIPDIGTLTYLKELQREALLTKAKTALSTTNVCDMDTSDLINLGVVSLAFSIQDIGCLPLNDTSLIASLGSLDGWTSAELSAIASRYLGAGGISDLSAVTATDITMFGSVLCGFSANLVATVPSAEIGKSGSTIGDLEECSIQLLTELVQLASQNDSFGNISSWDAAEVTELKYLIAVLSDTEMKELPTAAIEGLDAEVIPVIPVHVLKEMTTEQLQSFTDAQAVSVTDDQMNAMTSQQKDILNKQSTGGEEVIEEVVINDSDSNNADSSTEISFAVFGLMVLFLLS